MDGAVFEGHSGEVACDHSHRWPEDIGLIHVDCATQKRALKDSARWYRDFIQSQRGGR